MTVWYLHFCLGKMGSTEDDVTLLCQGHPEGGIADTMDEVRQVCSPLELMTAGRSSGRGTSNALPSCSAFPTSPVTAEKLKSRAVTVPSLLLNPSRVGCPPTARPMARWNFREDVRSIAELRVQGAVFQQ
ncbi:Hypothetical protein Deide_1p00991 (plasmid) [Deinococcus deserti VCD115]|uniref:Uncharacterized protein n=1 Tax=Deinococcus deserti (strain DSM 17065 / CIP 109153 / LMG 22923 / VCD115) TaxID=546414 RepID=C1D273_DEIDV|nr:Hypothetical protein Deide_1p00991 [Deinococcus deserti VCD115]